MSYSELKAFDAAGGADADLPGDFVGTVVCGSRAYHVFDDGGA